MKCAICVTYRGVDYMGQWADVKPTSPEFKEAAKMLKDCSKGELTMELTLKDGTIIFFSKKVLQKSILSLLVTEE